MGAFGNKPIPPAGCERACAPCRGAACERYGRAAVVTVYDGGSGPSARDTIQETVDAVSGATWGTRNRIMEGLFQQDLADHGDAMPAYRPPGM